MTTHDQEAFPSVIAIVGATATGKTDAAITLAQEFGGEIVSIDSRYLYRGLDIGTAKPTPTQRAIVPHHLIDILDPTDDYSLALFQRDAFRTVEGIMACGSLPILAGGSPLYVRAVLEGWRIPEAPPDADFRAEMESLAESEGNEFLHQRLQTIDPLAAERILPQNVRRVIRALEIHHLTGQRMTDLEGKDPPDWDILTIGLHIERTLLHQRIDARVDAMLENGLVEEVQHLLDAGVPADCTAMRSIGYQEVVPYLRGEYDAEEMAQRIKFATHRYVRHQLTWLRKTPNIQWIDRMREDFDSRLSNMVRDHIQK
ncbi:MAG: tRNA (adenosine(37)-N6)-dimethylallyltransferase MiaA [Sphaerobacteraceae bacterium]|nr:MAG: tRNA (adenosine(37)-N6)-dimethylallyltransferase MiaA [Sphaerobacteraceae bacterium]